MWQTQPTQLDLLMDGQLLQTQLRSLTSRTRPWEGRVMMMIILRTILGLRKWRTKPVITYQFYINANKSRLGMLFMAHM